MPKTRSDRSKTFATVGELVMICNAIDHLLNQVIIATFSLERTPLLEPVIASLDARQKIEMIKSRAKIIKKSVSWKKGFMNFCNKAESVYKQRNIVCHTPAALEDDRWSFKPITVVKMFSKIDLQNKTLKEFPFNDIVDAIKTGEAALGEGTVLLENLATFNAELKRRSIGVAIID